jgi:hypothetical protein
VYGPFVEISDAMCARKPVGNIGDRFGRLTLLGRVPGCYRWACKCDCGRIKTFAAGNLRRISRACGSCRKMPSGSSAPAFVHGRSKSPEFRSWRSMKARCLSESHSEYRHYGGRGITICERWESFVAFFDDMGPRPKGTSLDRIDNNGNYEPGNCRWATTTEQSRNRRNSVDLTVDGVTKPLVEFAKDSGINQNTLAGRISRGWDVKEALYTPAKHTRRWHGDPCD